MSQMIVSKNKRIEVRIGINLGEVIVEGDDRYGEGVNIAARLRDGSVGCTLVHAIAPRASNAPPIGGYTVEHGRSIPLADIAV
jgi:class 3 adenylate cyclase